MWPSKARASKGEMAPERRDVTSGMRDEMANKRTGMNCCEGVWVLAEVAYLEVESFVSVSRWRMEVETIWNGDLGRLMVRCRVY